MKEKYGFVYIWRDKMRKMFYIGCHWGSIDDRYICSSNRMRDAFRRRPSDFKRRILESNIKDRKLLLDREYVWLQKIKQEELSKKYYNAINTRFGHWSETQDKSGKNHPRYGKSHTEEAKRKISEFHKGKIPWNKGKTGIYSDETRKKISNAHIGNQYNKGNVHSTDARKRMSLIKIGSEPWNKGKTGVYSDETLKKMSESSKGQIAWNKGKKCEQLSGDRNGAKKLKGKTWFFNKETNKREWL